MVWMLCIIVCLVRMMVFNFGVGSVDFVIICSQLVYIC